VIQIKHPLLTIAKDPFYFLYQKGNPTTMGQKSIDLSYDALCALRHLFLICVNLRNLRTIKKKSEIEGAFGLFECLALDGVGIYHGGPYIAKGSLKNKSAELALRFGLDSESCKLAYLVAAIE
jgi:hypothetical protein